MTSVGHHKTKVRPTSDKSSVAISKGCCSQIEKMLIQDMEDLEGLDELQKKFEERTPTLPDTNISEISNAVSEKVFLQNDSSNTNENITPSENLSSKKETSEKTSISIKETSIGRQILKNPIAQEKMVPLFFSHRRLPKV